MKIGVAFLCAGIVLLLFGAYMFCLSNAPANAVSLIHTRNIAAQSGSNVVKFTMNENYGNYVLFDVNGTCSFSNSSWVKILNQKGETVFNYPIDRFPNNASIPASGRYAAVFEGVTLDPFTFYEVYVNIYSYTQIFPFSALMPFTLFVGIIGFILFAMGMKIAVFSSSIGKDRLQTEKSQQCKPTLCH